MKHTPGEWKAVRMATNHEVQTTDGARVIADVYSAGTGTHEANARLIAAAPEMHKALTAAQQLLNGYAPANDNSALKDAIAAVLAKVEGEVK